MSRDLEDQKYLTVTQVAKILQVTPGTIRIWLAQGDLRGRRLRGVWRIKRSDFDRFIWLAGGSLEDDSETDE